MTPDKRKKFRAVFLKIRDALRATPKDREIAIWLDQEQAEEITKALGSFLMRGKNRAPSLDHAFGLVKPRGGQAGKTQHFVTMLVVRALKESQPELKWREIAEAVGWKGDPDHIKQTWALYKDDIEWSIVDDYVKKLGERLR